MRSVQIGPYGPRSIGPKGDAIKIFATNVSVMLIIQELLKFTNNQILFFNDRPFQQINCPYFKQLINDKNFTFCGRDLSAWGQWTINVLFCLVITILKLFTNFFAKVVTRMHKRCTKFLVFQIIASLIYAKNSSKHHCFLLIQLFNFI